MSPSLPLYPQRSDPNTLDLPFKDFYINANVGSNMVKSSTMIVFLSNIIFTILILAPPLTAKASPASCTYLIKIETTCAPFAGTNDAVGVRFSDKDGNSIIVKQLKNPKLGLRNGASSGNVLKRCAIDTFEVSGVCMNEVVCSLYVKKFGSDGWRPGWVEVLHKRGDGRVSMVSYKFYFRTFVPENVWFGFDYCGSNRGGALPQVASFGGET